MVSSGSEPRVRAWRQLRAIAPLPGVVAGAVPVLLVWRFGIDVGWSLPAPASLIPLAVGTGLIVTGLRLWLDTVRLFATAGEGTLAPWDPTRKLVVRGPYRRVRNPMISAVGSVLLGEAALLGSVPLLIWFGVFAAVNMIFIPLAEEPDLARRFGDQYLEYRSAVPRWIPRRSPWSP
jgi:protein-S-isoprenylcysteine O-methyltransferase Ste14